VIPHHEGEGQSRHEKVAPKGLARELLRVSVNERVSQEAHFVNQQEEGRQTSDSMSVSLPMNKKMASFDIRKKAAIVALPMICACCLRPGKCAVMSENLCWGQRSERQEEKGTNNATKAVCDEINGEGVKLLVLRVREGRCHGQCGKGRQDVQVQHLVFRVFASSVFCALLPGLLCCVCAMERRKNDVFDLSFFFCSLLQKREERREEKSQRG